MIDLVGRMSRLRCHRTVRRAEFSIRIDLGDQHERTYFESLVGGERTLDQLVAERLPRSGDVVLDVGANLGYCSLVYAAEEAPEIHAVEPQPTFIRRRRRVSEDWFHVYDFALEDHCGIGEPALSSAHNQGHTLNRIRPEVFPCVYGETEEVSQVDVTTVDALLPGTSFDFVKVDIEGSEPRGQTTPGYAGHPCSSVCKGAPDPGTSREGASPGRTR